MTAAITTLRASLAAALSNTNVWNTYSYPPPTITANSVIVSPADPYITPSNNEYVSISPLANFRVICNVPMYDNQGNLQGIETMLVAVINKLAASSIVMNIGSVSAPSVLTVQSGDLLTVDVNISILSSWE
jgi:hypothetical protein